MTTQRDWPADFKHVDGDHELTCRSCGESFRGHKRRTICAACVNTPPAVPVPSNFASALGTVRAYLEAIEKEHARYAEIVRNEARPRDYIDPKTTGEVSDLIEKAQRHSTLSYRAGEALLELERVQRIMLGLEEWW